MNSGSRPRDDIEPAQMVDAKADARKSTAGNVLETKRKVCWLVINEPAPAIAKIARCVNDLQHSSQFWIT